MKLQLKPQENKRMHNKGMRNLKQLVITHKISLDIDWIGGRYL